MRWARENSLRDCVSAAEVWAVTVAVADSAAIFALCHDPSTVIIVTTIATITPTLLM